MKVANKEEARHLVVAVVLLGVMLIACAVLWFTGRLGEFVAWMFEIFKGRDELRAYVESWGAWAPVAFITIQALQVVVAPIPGELTGAVGGFIFGAGLNVLYSTVGLTVGSIIGFAGARIIGLPLVKLVVPAHFLEKFHFLTERRGTLLTLAFFAFPGFPKDLLCYVLGLSPMSFAMFVIVCTVGRIPGTVLLSFSGSAVYDQNWTLLIVLAVVCLVTMGIVFLVRDKLDRWLMKRHHRESLSAAANTPARREATTTPGS
jgi:uncharacterized membrane protein YdjX (TVP38/TMEM64 family)